MCLKIFFNFSWLCEARSIIRVAHVKSIQLSAWSPTQQLFVASFDICRSKKKGHVTIPSKGKGSLAVKLRLSSAITAIGKIRSETRSSVVSVTLKNARERKRGRGKQSRGKEKEGEEKDEGTCESRKRTAIGHGRSI
ncbi:hypothetical protein PUN28_010160 [Cardiocondyla obscurior]|uniref:Uncharacterized protein n=1 Tax=Cardiocondyla obscurior TaxID=286306 RepID=A0AAW2FPD1_9HYME